MKQYDSIFKPIKVADTTLNTNTLHKINILMN